MFIHIVAFGELTTNMTNEKALGGIGETLAKAPEQAMKKDILLAN